MARTPPPPPPIRDGGVNKRKDKGKSRTSGLSRMAMQSLVIKPLGKPKPSVRELTLTRWKQRVSPMLQVAFAELDHRDHPDFFRFVQDTLRIEFSKQNVRNDLWGYVIPSELLIKIFSFLDMESILTASLVCLRWATIAGEEILWEQKYMERYLVRPSSVRFSFRFTSVDLLRMRSKWAIGDMMACFLACAHGRTFSNTLVKFHKNHYVIHVSGLWTVNMLERVTLKKTTGDINNWRNRRGHSRRYKGISSEVLAVALSDRYVASAERTGVIRVWTVKKNHIAFCLQWPGKLVRHLEFFTIDGEYHIVASAPADGYIAVWKLERQLDLTGETTNLALPLQTVLLKPPETAGNNAAPAAGAPRPAAAAAAAAAAGAGAGAADGPEANAPNGQNGNDGHIEQHPEYWQVSQLFPLPQGLIALIQPRNNTRFLSTVLRIWTWEDFFTKGGRGVAWEGTPLGRYSRVAAANESRTLFTHNETVLIFHTADIFAYASAIYPKIQDGGNSGGKLIRNNALASHASRVRGQPGSSQQASSVLSTATGASTGAAALNVAKPKVQGTIRQVGGQVVSISMYNDLAALCVSGGSVVLVDLLTNTIVRKFTIRGVTLRYAVLGPDSLHVTSSAGKAWAYFIEPSGPASRRRADNLRTANTDVIEKTRLDNQYSRYY